jgi:hypothetical protein
MKIELRDRVRFIDTDGIRREGIVGTTPGIHNVDGHMLPFDAYVVAVRGFVGVWRVTEDMITNVIN